jgi:hypothetical protein
LLAVSGTLGQNQLVASLVRTPTARVILIAAISCSGVIALVSWLLQRRAVAFAEWLVSAEAQRQIFMFGVCYRATDIEDSSPPSVRFTKGDVIAVIEGISQRQLAMPAILTRLAKWLAKKTVYRSKQDSMNSRLLEYRIEQAISNLTTFGRLSATEAERIAMIHLDELMRRGLIREAPDRTIDIAYIAEKSVMENS